MLRQALAADVPAMHRVRTSVRENRLASTVITEADYFPAIEKTGRGWVVEIEGQVVAFAIGNKINGNVWALFVDPGHEHRGYGRQLHDEMVNWLLSQGTKLLWLTTAPGTRAERFYEKAGWRRSGVTEKGEVRFERTGPSLPPKARFEGVLEAAYLLGFAALFFAPLATHSALPPGTPFLASLRPIGLSILLVFGYLGLVIAVGWCYDSWRRRTRISRAENL